MDNIQNKKLSLVVNAGVTVDLSPDDKHEFLMAAQDVAKGYDVTMAVIQDSVRRHAVEFIEGKHFIHSPEDVMWTKRGVVRLGLFIDGPKVRRFWDMIEDLKLSPTPESSDTFTFPTTNHPVRTVMINKEPWFVAKDVCNILGIRNASLTRFDLDEDEAGVHKMYIRSKSGVNQQREMVIVSESGLYALIFHSHKPGAKAFRKLVTSEVLPAIRRTGKYTPEIMENDCPYTRDLPELHHQTPTMQLLEVMRSVCKIEDTEVRSHLADKLIQAMQNVDV
ncbi:MAG: Bro-N domain-containing protein [Bacteroidales bacterium]|jgi:prophage antirepressor-like protein|nr:Bro-N domain-containing protein [Bacteroidales bacterium]